MHAPRTPNVARRAAAFALIALALVPVESSAEVIGEIDRIRRPGLYEVAFALADDATVRVRAVGAGPTENEPLLSYAWILDAGSRRPVWQMTRENTNILRRGGEDRIFEGDVGLAAGRYIAYFSALQRHYERPRRSKLFDKLFGSIRTPAGFLVRWNAFGEPRRWGLWLETAGGDGTVREWDGEIEDDGFLHFAPLGDDAFESAAFRVGRPVDVTLLCVCEYDAAGQVYADRAWVADALTHEIVWETNERDAEPAGGASKNHAFEVRLALEPGDYVLSCVTDGSHSFDDWNESPPHDPQAWGASLRVDDAEAVELIRDPREELLICGIDRVRDASFERRAFVLERALKVRLEGTGELDDHRFVDYGWLERVSDGKVVWSMIGGKGEPAGGHDINRFVADAIDLEPGTYVLSFVTDGLHAYGGWRFPAPNDPTAWGVRIFAATRDFDPSWVSPIDADDADPAVIRLAPTGDHTHRKQLMTLPKAYDLRVVCMGEGLDGRMYDYGWIEDAETNRTVWKMAYEDARHAGGADKNVVVDTGVSLQPGRYLVHYVSDGSHSFEGWNAARPDDPQLWGITIYHAGFGPELPRRWR